MVFHRCIPQKILSWIILILGAASVIFLGGKRRAFGAFVTRLHDVYPNVTLMTLDWIGDSYSAFGCMTTTISTAIIIYFGKRYGLFQFIGALAILLSCVTSAYVPNPYWLFLTHTILHGIGSSVILSNVGLVVNEHFTKAHPYRLLATSLISGGSVASLAFVFSFATLIDVFDWRNALLILGGIYFVVIGVATFFFIKKDDSTEAKDNRSFREIVTCRHIPLMIFWLIERVLTSVVTYGMLMNLTEFDFERAKENGIPSSSLSEATKYTMLFAGGEASAYLVNAFITAATKTLLKNRLKFVLLITSFIAGGSIVAMGFLTHSDKAMMVMSFFAGFGLGPSNALLFPGGEEMTRLPGQFAYPFTLGGMGLGMLISPPLSGLIMQQVGNRVFFWVQGGLVLLKVICILIIMVILFVYMRMTGSDYKMLFSINVRPTSEFEKLIKHKIDPETETFTTLSIT